MVYPNPVKDKLNINFKSFTTNEVYKIEVYSANGQQFYSGKLTEQKTEISFNSAKAGVYFIVIENQEGKREWWKVTKN